MSVVGGKKRGKEVIWSIRTMQYILDTYSIIGQEDI